MYYLTFDAEIADRFLPSICEIGIIAWQDGIMVSQYHTYVNPDCNVEEFFNERHGISDDFLSKAPFIQNVWIPIYDMLDGNLVFFYDPNRMIKTLSDTCTVNQLNLPDFRYASVSSISRRLWKGLDDYRIINVTEWMGLTHSHNSAIEDAKSVGLLINEAIKDAGCEDVEELFHAVGYAGGEVSRGRKLPYRAYMDKKNGGYKKRTA